MLVIYSLFGCWENASKWRNRNCNIFFFFCADGFVYSCVGSVMGLLLIVHAGFWCLDYDWLSIALLVYSQKDNMLMKSVYIVCEVLAFKTKVLMLIIKAACLFLIPVMLFWLMVWVSTSWIVWFAFKRKGTCKNGS